MMGNRGVDLAQLKEERAVAQRVRDMQALLEWATQLKGWLESPLEEGEIEERSIKVAFTDQTLILSRRLAPEEEQPI